MRKRALLLTLPFLAAMAFGQDTLDLRFKPKANEVRKYESKLSLDAGGVKVDVNIKQSNKVLEVAENGDYKQEVTTVDQKVLVNGEEQNQETPPASTHKRSAKGDLLELSSKVTNPLSQVGVFTRFLMVAENPVKIGDKWTREFKKNDDLGTGGATLKYELLSKEKVGEVEVAKVKFSYLSEEKGSATGEIWIRISDGTTYQLDAKFEGVSPMDGAPDATGTISMKLTEG